MDVRSNCEDGGGQWRRVHVGGRHALVDGACVEEPCYKRNVE